VGASQARQLLWSVYPCNQFWRTSTHLQHGHTNQYGCTIHIFVFRLPNCLLKKKILEIVPDLKNQTICATCIQTYIHVFHNLTRRWHPTREIHKTKKYFQGYIAKLKRSFST
jgi:hypothetical protein